MNKQCTYCTRREGLRKDQLHGFRKEARQITSFFDKNKHNNNDDNEHSKIAILCARSGLSFSQVASDPLWDCLTNCKH
jgi:hypothetical protein